MTEEKKEELFQLCESISLFLKNNGEICDAVVITSKDIKFVANKE